MWLRTWGAHSNTGEENSATHAVSAHGILSAYYTAGAKSQTQEFTTGDLDTDAAALVAWITELADRHVRTRQ